MAPLIISIAGSTGTLGQLLAKHLFAMNKEVTVRAMIRPSSLEKDEAKYLRDNGAEIVAGDLTDAVAVEKLVAGAYTVISAAQGGPDLIIDAQTKLLEACKKAGVKRFVPTDFSYNHFNLKDGDNLNSDWRRAFAHKADGMKGNVQVVHVLNGCFMDKQVLFGFLGAISIEESKLFVYGDVDSKQKIHFTTFNDTAAYTAAMAVDKSDQVPDRFQIAGDSLTVSELAAAYMKGSGTSLEIVRKGSLEDLSASIDKAQTEDPANMLGYLPGMYWRAMLNGAGHYEPTGNALYPTIAPEKVEDYVKHNIA